MKLLGIILGITGSMSLQLRESHDNQQSYPVDQCYDELRNHCDENQNGASDTDWEKVCVEFTVGLRTPYDTEKMNYLK